MADIVDSKTRSQMMAGIRSKNTRPEMLIRRALHQRGFRYNLHTSKLPGNPDLVFPSLKAAVFVHGCFWHGHNCHLFKWPKSRASWWREKIQRSRKRDREVMEELYSLGWRQARVWECALKGRARLDLDDAIIDLVDWLDDDKRPLLEIEGLRS